MEIIKCKNNFDKIVSLPKDKFRFRLSAYAILRRGPYILTCRNKSNGKLWFPGGGVEKGETLEQALLRECLEETGIKNIEVNRLLGDFRNYFYHEPADFAMDAHLHFYECFTTEENVYSNDEIEDEEACDLKWLKINQILEEDISDLSKEIYQLLRLLKN